MRYSITIPDGARLWCYSILPFGDFQRIDVDGVVILDICKFHNHRYDLQAFFYARKHIVSCRSFSTKKELYGAIQNLLQEYL